MAKKSLALLAARFLSGEATAGEKAELQALLRRPENKAWFTVAKEKWDAAAPKPVGGFDLKSALKRLDARLVGGTAKSGSAPKRTVRKGV